MSDGFSSKGLEGCPLEPTSKEKSRRRRLIAFAVVIGLVLLAFLVRLVQYQLVEGPAHVDASSEVSVASSSVEPAAPGGGPAPGQ
ncbi:MAG: hypothetical protein AB7V55_04135 [Oscillospiraceae bacterium]